MYTETYTHDIPLRNYTFCSGLFQVSWSLSAEVSISLLRYPMPLKRAYLVYNFWNYWHSKSTIMFTLHSVSICYLIVRHDYVRRNTSTQFWFKIQFHGFYETCIPENVVLIWNNNNKTLLALIGCVTSDRSLSYFKTQFALWGYLCAKSIS